MDLMTAAFVLMGMASIAVLVTHEVMHRRRIASYRARLLASFGPQAGSREGSDAS